jgi:hypothetical protein
MERLTGRDSKGVCYRHGKESGLHPFADRPSHECKEAIEKLAKYEDAEEEGRLVIIPCKVGDTVYWADADIEMCCIHTGVVGAFSVDNEEGKLWCYVRYDDGLRYHHRVDAFFGKSVFLTMEEAEKALKGESI